ncbi:MAG: phosphatidate cytidylyltransferase [Alistipes sp.]|nr:phosphatidate cytidylyltransferase [Alistipes sp.]MBR2014031.1 phosphatidate cytidylyltransferase [Alistipes sp.]
MKNFWLRSISGFVLLGIVLVAILWAKWSLVLLLAAIIVGGQREFYRMASKAGYAPQRYLGIAAGLILLVIAFWLMLIMDESPLINWDRNIRGDYLLIIFGLFLFITISLPLMFIYELFRKSPTPIANVGTTLMGFIYVAMPMSMLLFIPLMLTPDVWRAKIVLFYIFIIWANDSFAYLFGITLGKHRLFERISPKKSWEGFVGGLFGAALMGFIAAKDIISDMELCGMTDINEMGVMVKWIGMALIAAVAGVFGDLVESLFKRSIDIKDSGRIMPGHGGWLDRFDALLLSIPFSFIYLVCCETFLS